MSNKNYVFFEKDNSRYFKLNMLGGGYQRFSMYVRRSDGRPRLRLNDAKNSETILCYEDFVKHLLFYIKDYWKSDFEIKSITRVITGKDFELVFDIEENGKKIDYLTNVENRDVMFISPTLLTFFDYFSEFLCNRSSWYGTLKRNKVLYECV
tara:strand:- start:338 stop:793 length:456 start_codon:yes stop_codon:yes gene_type:complete